jgi:hypothetical protein
MAIFIERDKKKYLWHGKCNLLSKKNISFSHTAEAAATMGMIVVTQWRIWRMSKVIPMPKRRNEKCFPFT